MSHRLVVRLFATLVAAIGAAAVPAIATAAVTPTIALNESAGNAGGSTSSIGFVLGFNSTANDSVKSISLDLPSGVWINEEINSGACLTAGAPTPACEIGSGTATLNGTSTSLAAYLVAPQRTGDLAGVEIVAGALISVGDLTIKSSSSLGIDPSVGIFEEITWSSLPASPAVSLMNLTLNGLALPSSCLPANAAVSTSSQQDTLPARATAPFVVTACNALQYSPTMSTVAVSRFAGLVSGAFEVVLNNPPGGPATQEFKMYVPPNILPDTALTPCINGVTCTIGTVTMSSPVLPAGQTTGTIGVSGTVRALTFVLNFPALGIVLDATWGSSFSGPVISLSNLPDLPVTTLTLDFIGNSLGGAFTIECYPTQMSAVATSWNGLPGTDLNANTALSGCAHSGNLTAKPPQASASVAGLHSGSPKISVVAAKGKNAPGIASVVLSLPRGFGFSGQVLKGGRVSKGVLAVSGATVKRATVSRGTLSLTFLHAVSKSVITLAAPLLTDSTTTGHVTAQKGSDVTVRIIDSVGRQTKLSVPLKVKS
jgi:hypothetical protein